ncbi:MAG: lipid A deacylase LpxR family protein [Pseudomonadales bacterium]
MSIVKAIALASFSVATVTSVNASDVEATPAAEYETVVVESGATKKQGYNSWSFAFDNDVLVPGSRDQDYTYGLSATLSSETAPKSPWSLDTPLQWIDQHSGFSSLDLMLGGQVRTYSTELGLYGFTPENISSEAVSAGDRPYASLLYLSNSREYEGTSSNTVWRSTFTVGILGLDLVGDLQNEVHAVIGSEEAQGWRNQISDGGEPTARYSVARQRLWSSGYSNVEIKTSVQGSIGYLTELSYGVSVRVGHIATRWQSFNPELASYREHSVPVLIGKGFQESYFSVGIAIKARAYNAFLQGQFRDSTVEYGSGDLNHALVEAWVGYTHIFANGYRVSYTVRGHSSELKRGVGDRNVLWGGLTLTRNY